MGLAQYKQKRDFKKSPEPTGGKPGEQKLRFVIQKHDASHLHYDFRLEMEGVLKSWAVPKGPSTDPAVKRLAMMVEDHPFDYRNFEGIIPSGYGAGTVIIWDEGYYEPINSTAKTKKDQERELLQQLQKGSLKFALHGKKLKGEFALVKVNGRGENGWLLIKHRDEYASTDDITKKEKSVVSNKTLAQVEKTSTNFYGEQRVKESSRKSKKETELQKNRPTIARKTKADVEKKEDTKKKASATKTSKEIKTPKVKAEAKKKTSEENPEESLEAILKKAPKGKFSTTLSPMLATLVDKPFDEPGWVYEVKWDGYRAIAFCNKKSIELKSRNDKSFNEKFYAVTNALKALNVQAIFDGEIVVVNDEGISNFESLQNWRSEADGELLYYVFDLLWYEGKDLTALSLKERKAALREVMKTVVSEEGIIKLSDSFGGSGTEFFEATKKIGLEGMIAKKENSTYQAGFRSNEWLKIKASKRQELVIGGFTKNEDSSKLFSALLVGVFEGKELVYAGKVGTGYSDKTQQEMMKLFRPLIIKKSPFTELPDVNKPSRFRPDPPHATATWLKPELVCEVSFTEVTRDGVLRHPSFEGMRIDKKAKDVVREKERSAKAVVKETKEEAKKEKIKTKAETIDKKMVTPVTKKERKTLLNPTDETQVRDISGHELKFTNLSKIYWPKEKITKRDLLNYYYQVAPYILPYLKDRPQSMNRHPDGITGESFYYKDVTGKAPDWVRTFLYHSGADNRDRKYLVAEDEASLLYMASLGCIEMNPWSSRVETEDYPDWCMIDLDPSPKNTYDQVIEAALMTKQVLEEIGVKGYPKTSGSTGMHIYIPFGAKYTYEQSKEFARVIVTLVQQHLPKFTSIKRTVREREGKMYLDFLQNRPQATISAPYSVRPKPGAPVSMPLHWEEVKKGLKITDFNIHNALDRIKSEGDLFKPVLGKGIDLEKVIKKFEL
ncbi:MAG TPA: DNA ligase D [Cytophagaceae bacterium]|nr:DNA ligase D [Cytophagaceae bacterium]